MPMKMETLEKIESYLESGSDSNIRQGVKLLYFYLDGIPDEEPIDQDVIEIWQNYKGCNNLKILVPKRVYEKIDSRLQAHESIDADINHIEIDDNTKIVFLLGAGASVSSGIPTVNGLLPELWRKAKKLNRDDLDKLAEWCDEKGISNIEDLLTAAYLSDFAAKNGRIASLLDYFLFAGKDIESGRKSYYTPIQRAYDTETNASSIGFLQDTLQTLFSFLTSIMIVASPNPTHDAIVNFIKNTQSNVSIITTNYDGCMDEALLNSDMHITGTINKDGEIIEDKSHIKLIKMHGSINWAYCESCQASREFDLLDIKKAYTEDKYSYAVMGICKNCGGVRRPLLVPPLSFKFLMFPHLIDLWNSARQIIEDADYIIVVGYSFSEADSYISKIISGSMDTHHNQKIIIVDTNQKVVSTQRDKLSANIHNFKKDRVLGVIGRSEEMLPKVLDLISNSKKKE